MPPKEPQAVSVPNPLAGLADKHKIFANPFSKAHTAHTNPLEKHRQTIDDLVAAAAKPAYEQYYSRANIKNINTRCENMDETIGKVVNVYMNKGNPSRQIVLKAVSDKIVNSCKKMGIFSVQQMASVMDDNRNSIEDRLAKVNNVGNTVGGTRKSIRRKSKTRRHRR